MRPKNLFQLLLLSVMLIVGTTGCYDEDEIKDAEKYIFQDIRYNYEDEEDGLTFYDIKFAPRVIRNDSPMTITVTDDPYKNTWVSTTFKSYDPEAFTWMGEEEVWVTTPNILGDSVYPDEVEVRYCNETVKTESIISAVSTINVPPHHKLIIEDTFHYSKLVATYTLTFVGEFSKTKKKIKGKFIRTTPESHSGKKKLVEITD